MIVAERKSFEKIWEFASKFQKILIAGCGECVTVCFAGGEREVSILASQLRLRAQKEGKELEVHEYTVKRQCDVDFMEELKKKSRVEAIISLACGAGVQFVAEYLFPIPVFPGVDTKFLGGSHQAGEWVENCLTCGECILDRTGGICPVARCSKSLLNGPCGGSQEGRCEVDQSIECAWQLIIDRMKEMGRLGELEQIEPPKDWSQNRDGGPRRVLREDLKIDESGK